MLLSEMAIDYQGETRLLLHNGGKEEQVWNIGKSLGLLSIAMSCNESQCEMQQNNSGRTIDGSNQE
jgi:hypothetical protein